MRIDLEKVVPVLLVGFLVEEELAFLRLEEEVVVVVEKIEPKKKKRKCWLHSPMSLVLLDEDEFSMM